MNVQAHVGCPVIGFQKWISEIMRHNFFLFPKQKVYVKSIDLVKIWWKYFSSSYKNHGMELFLNIEEKNDYYMIEGNVAQ